VVSGISEIRNKYGDAHGKGDQQKVSELTQNYVDVMVNMTVSIEKKTNIELEYRSSFQIEDYSKLDLSEFE
jgi:hypothetical protein